MKKNFDYYMYCEFKICFEENFDVDSISEILDIKPTFTQRTNRNEKTERIWKTQDWNEFNSLWEYKTKKVNTLMVEDVLNTFFDVIENKIDTIHELIEANKGFCHLCIVGEFSNKTYPAISMEQCHVNKLARLGASIDFDFYY